MSRLSGGGGFPSYNSISGRTGMPMGTVVGGGIFRKYSGGGSNEMSKVSTGDAVIGGGGTLVLMAAMLLLMFLIPLLLLFEPLRSLFVKMPGSTL